ncbi:MAG: hypothetical protein ACRD6X_12700 [Pyrinomonadaceae bacterium]
MSLLAVFGVAIFLAAAVLSQKLALNAREKLDDETKLKIADVFAKLNFNYSLIVFAVVIAYFVALYTFPQYNGIFSIGYGLIFSIYIFAKLILNVRKLRAIDAPQDYINRIIQSFGIFIGGAILAVFVVVVGSSF